MNPLEPFGNLLHKRAGPIVKYQALGDSYSAGNQAGDPVNSGGGGNNCMRTDGSYAYQLMNDPDVVNQGGSGYRTYIPGLSHCHSQNVSGCQYLSEGVVFQRVDAGEEETLNSASAQNSISLRAPALRQPMNTTIKFKTQAS